MSIYSELQKCWMDSDGLVSPYKINEPRANASGNGVLYWAYAVAVMRSYPIELTVGVMVDWATYVGVGCTVEPGLLRRGPHQTDQEGPDDYIGYLAASSMVSKQYSQQVYAYGQTPIPLTGIFADKPWSGLFDRIFGRIKVRYVYNNVSPGKISREAWLGRQPQLIAHMEWSGGTTPPLWRQIWWACVVATSGKGWGKGPEQDWMLSWMLVEIAGEKTWLNRLASRIWRKRLKRLRGSMKNVLTAYFEPGHPIVEYCQL